VTYYTRDQYGAYNCNAGKPANGDKNAWGGYAWTNCPPGSLLGTTNYAARASGQTLKVQVRKELIELLTLVFQICDKHNYPVYSSRNGENWGPWGFSCRSVSGTNTPSGHSMALSVDINAPYNPYSYTFQSDMPPDMVKAIESVGWYWGGRYQGQKYDAMHYGYCWTPADVAGHVQKAKEILGGSPPEPPEPPKEWDELASKEEIAALVNNAPFLKVYRHNQTQIDYAAGPGRFKFINSPDDYHFLRSCGWIVVDHGAGQPVETNLLEYIRNEASKGAGEGTIDDIIYPG
jgi:D-alanyl-D-alanine carboxypeptidase